MFAVTHSFKTLWSRFRWEILGYLGLVVLSCLCNSAGSRWAVGAASLRTLGSYWLTFRILLSETGYRTHGGWRARPFTANSIFISQILLLLAIFLPGSLAKAVAYQQLFQPTFGQWIFLLKSACSKIMLPLLVFGLVLKCFEYFIRRQTQGRMRKVVWAVMIVVLIPAFFIPAAKVPAKNMNNTIVEEGYQWSGTKISQGIIHLLPPSANLVGSWFENRMKAEVPQARLLARFPLMGNPPAPSSGIRILSLESADRDLRSTVKLELVAINSADLYRLERATPILAYSDGSYGVAISYRISTADFGGIASGVNRSTYHLLFVSPRSLPENRQASPEEFTPKELLFFTEDAALPSLQVFPALPSANGPNLSAPLMIPLPTAGAPFDLAVRQLIDNFDRGKLVIKAQEPLRQSLPREAMAPILAYHPWPDLAWEAFIEPFLKKHASETDKPVLLQRLALDPRLTELFITKGWAADAVPVLRERAKQRLPLDAIALTLLVEQDDPSLSPDIAALAIRLDRGIGELAPKLRQSPAFDWTSFVAAGWKSRKYGDYDTNGNYDKDCTLYASWSAELGDFSGFHRLAERAASGSDWDVKHLIPLVAGEHEDLIGYLRVNIDRMKFDPVTKKWGL